MQSHADNIANIKNTTKFMLLKRVETMSLKDLQKVCAHMIERFMHEPNNAMIVDLMREIIEKLQHAESEENKAAQNMKPESEHDTNNMESLENVIKALLIRRVGDMSLLELRNLCVKMMERLVNEPRHDKVIDLLCIVFKKI